MGLLSLSKLRDHPRVCGEHITSTEGTADSTGSSPRVRGTLRDGQRAYEAAGIIPACAGNTGKMVGNVDEHGDHPRVCGEHPFVAGIAMVPTWIIPACAGNTV